MPGPMKSHGMGRSGILLALAKVDASATWLVLSAWDWAEIVDSQFVENAASVGKSAAKVRWPSAGLRWSWLVSMGSSLLATSDAMPSNNAGAASVRLPEPDRWHPPGSRAFDRPLFYERRKSD